MRLPLLCGAAMLLLCGCAGDGNTDLSERYPAYFKYCFGDDAACRFEKIQDDLVHLYTVVYSDKNGEERRMPLSVLPYDKERAAEYENSRSYYDAVLETAVTEELAAVCRADYIAHVLPDYFSGTVTLSPETDAAPYLTQIQAAYEAFLSAGEAPKSCTFQLRQRGETGEDSVSLLWRETVLCGEVLDTAEENEEHGLWGTLEEKLREYYRQTAD